MPPDGADGLPFMRDPPPVPSGGITRGAVDATGALLVFVTNGAGVDRTTQLTWFINSATGNDANSGATSADALRTLTAWFLKSSNNGMFAFNTPGVVVTIETDLLPTDTPAGTVNVGSGTLAFVGVPGPRIHTGVATVTPAVPATNTAATLTDATVASFAPFVGLGFVNARMRTIAGSNPGAVFWPAKDLGGNSCRISGQMVPDPSLGPFGQSEVTIITGDAYVIEPLPEVPNFGLSFNVNAGATLETVTFENLAFTVVAPVGSVTQNNNDVGRGTSIGWYGCNWAPANLWGGDFVACRFADTSNFVQRGFMFGGLSMGTFIANGLASATIFEFNHMNQGGAMNFIAQDILLVRICVFDATFNAPLALTPAASIQHHDFLSPGKLSWGAGGAALNFWGVPGDTVVQYNSTVGMTGLGAGGAADALLIGAGAGTFKAYAALPFTDTNSLSGVFVE